MHGMHKTHVMHNANLSQMKKLSHQFPSPLFPHLLALGFHAPSKVICVSNDLHFSTPYVLSALNNLNQESPSWESIAFHISDTHHIQPICVYKLWYTMNNCIFINTRKWRVCDGGTPSSDCYSSPFCHGILRCQVFMSYRSDRHTRVSWLRRWVHLLYKASVKFAQFPENTQVAYPDAIPAPCNVKELDTYMNVDVMSDCN